VDEQQCSSFVSISFEEGFRNWHGGRCPIGPLACYLVDKFLDGIIKFKLNTKQKYILKAVERSFNSNLFRDISSSAPY